MLDVMNSIFNFLSFHWSSRPWFQLLLVLMVADVFTGILRAWQERCLNSAIAGKGMRTKALMVMFVVLAARFENGTGVAASEYISKLFCLTELISILENAAKMSFPGVKILWKLFGSFFGRFETLPNSFEERETDTTKHDSKEARPDVFVSLLNASVNQDREEQPDATAVSPKSNPTTPG